MTFPAKIRRILPAARLLCLFQFLTVYSTAQNIYPLFIRSVDKDSAFLLNNAGLQTSFISRSECIAYVNKLPAALQSKGYVTASVDSILFDTTSAKMVLYLGNAYRWAHLNTDNAEPSLLQSSGWNAKQFAGKPVDFERIKALQEKMLRYLENNGYPFAKIFLDSLQLQQDSVSAQLKVEKGPLYRIDSIRIFGEAKVSNNFLQHYLDILNGSIYSREKLLRISKKILELNYVQEEQPSDITMLGTGSVLNLYLKTKKNNQVNALIGFLPKNDQLSSKKLLVTGEANINLRNALGAGETIGLNWQQLQVKSPRLNIIYQHPFLFNSPLGFDFAFDMLRKDSSFLNVNLNFGARYLVSTNQTCKLFLQRFQTILSQGGINTAFIIQNRRLPDVADVSSTNLGIDYEISKTNYRLNPKSGTEYRITVSAGTKKIKKNNEILELKDPGDPSFDFERLYDTVKLKTYLLRFSGSAAKYFPLGKQSTIKTAINGGLLQSDNIFRNELFQIGGYKMLRGFDEESQYVSQFAIATLEYRYLFGLNSYFFVFADGGWARNTSRISKYSHTYFGTGLGMAFETKGGIFNLAWAVGTRDDSPFNLRQSKIHIGFVNYF
jgi:outer membrane protein assembly factor BamA